MKYGFSLIEVLVVMAIVAVLLSMGIVGLVQFRTVTEVKESGRQLVEVLDLLKNAARNDVRPDVGINSINFKGYKYDFANKRLEYCLEDIIGNTVIQNWSCKYDSSVEEVFFNVSFPIHFGKALDFNNPINMTECIAIYFESLTGDIQVTDSSGTIFTNIQCFVPFTDFSTRKTAYLYIDALTDTYIIVTDLANVNRFN